PIVAVLAFPSRLSGAVRVKDLGLGGFDTGRSQPRQSRGQRDNEDQLSHVISPERVVVSIVDWPMASSRQLDHIGVNARVSVTAKQIDPGRRCSTDLPDRFD